jgi:hypothetical protein
MRYKITCPLKNFNGQSVGVVFKDSTAEIDDSNDAGRSAHAYFSRAGYRVEPIHDLPVDDDTEQDSGPFDPSDHKADEVLTFLDTASYEEAVRVLDAEADGKNRVTITGKRDEILANKTPTTPATADADQTGPQA